MIIELLDLIKKNKEIKMISIKINGYFLYRYRGILLVRKGFSDVLIVHDYNAIRRYLMHVVNNVLRSDYILWAKTSGLVEIIIEAEKKNKSGIIFIEASNDKLNEHGNFLIRVITHRDIEKEYKENAQNFNYSLDHSSSREMINEIDEMIIKEDLKKLTPIDIYDFFEVNEVEELINILSKNSESVSISDNVDLKR